MGRKLEQLTRGDSKDHIHFPLGSTRSRKRNYKPNKESKESIPDHSLDSHQSRKAKIDRVESIRNLFRRSRSWDSAKDLDDVAGPDLGEDQKRNTAPNPMSGATSSSLSNPSMLYEPSNLSHSLSAGNSLNLYRSISTSQIPMSEENVVTEYTSDEIITTEIDNIECKDGDKNEKKKSQFPYAFLRSKLSSVSEELANCRDECDDSGRGTESCCGSITDVRTSYSENSDSKSFSESYDKSSCSELFDDKSVKEEESECAMPNSSEVDDDSAQMPESESPQNDVSSGFNGPDYVVTLKVEGKKKKSKCPGFSNPESNQWNVWTQGSEFPCLAAKTEGLMTDEEKLRARSDCCRHCKRCGTSRENKRKKNASSAKFSSRSYSKASPLTSSGLVEANDNLASLYPRNFNPKRTSLDLELLHKRMEKLEKAIPGLKVIDSKYNLFNYNTTKLLCEHAATRLPRSLSLDRAETWQNRLDDSDTESLTSLNSPYKRKTPFPPKTAPSLFLSQSPLSSKNFKLIRLIKDKEDEELGLLINGRKNQGYIVAQIQGGSVAFR